MVSSMVMLEHKLARFRRKVQRLPLIAKAILLASACLSLIFYGSIIHVLYFHNHLQDSAFLELDKCPACFGRSICSALESGDFTFEGYSKIRFLDLVNVKNVYYGSSQKYGPVVFKKLGGNSELQHGFEKNLCSYARVANKCTVEEALQAVRARERNNLYLERFANFSEMALCGSERLNEKLVSHFSEKGSHGGGKLAISKKVNLLTTLLINQEPIIMQLFPALEGWPFPRYLGACGRFIVAEYVGANLMEYYDKPWRIRVDLASQIFQLAETLTNNKEGYALYPSDIKYHNLAVNSKGKVILVDLEHIIIVDKQQILTEKKGDWNQEYSNPFTECDSGYGDCISYEPKLMCSRLHNDFNYYSVCRNLLSSYGTERHLPGGFLHDTPPEIEAQYKLTELLNDCANPPTPGFRFKNKNKILFTLRNISLAFKTSGVAGWQSKNHGER